MTFDNKKISANFPISRLINKITNKMNDNHNIVSVMIIWIQKNNFKRQRYKESNIFFNKTFTIT